MKKIPYILKDLSIHKMPGFPRGLKAWNDLSAKVNIIVGPNASGKSSTARMIQQVIWQNNSKGIEVEASVSLDEDSWEIKLDSGRTLVQRNGSEDQINGLPTAEGKHRYLLALHNLVEGKETDLAKEIAKQSIGGFDLEAVKENLSYSSRFSNKGIAQYKDYEEANRKFLEVRNQQKSLKDASDNLINLRLEKDKAEQAARLNVYYNITIDYLERKSEHNQLSEQIHAFPKSMEKLSGNEYESIQEHESQIETCANTIEEAKAEIHNSEEELKKLSIPEAGINDKAISEIKERLEQLGTIERNIQDLNRKIPGFQSQESNALKGLDNSVDPMEWKGLNIEDVGGLDKMLQEAHQVLGEREFLFSEIKILKVAAGDYQENNQDSGVLTQGIKTLGEWIKEPVYTSGVPLWLVVLISLLGAIAAIATYFIGWLGLLGLVLILAFLIYAYFSQGKSENSLSVRENDLTKSGLNAPTSWNPESVANRLDELIESLRETKEAEQITQRLNHCKDSLDKLQPRLEKLNAKRKEWIDKLQVAPSFPENNSKDFSSLYWYLLQVNKWQEAHIQKEVLEAENTALKSQYKDELSKVNTWLRTFNFDEVKDVIEGKSSFTELEIQESTRKKQMQIIERQNEEIEYQKKLKQRSEGTLTKIYEALNIDSHNKESVLSLIHQIENYKQVSKDYYAVNLAFLRKEKLLLEHSLYKEEEIKTLSVDEAKEKADKNRVIADGLEAIQKEITEMETLIRTKKEGHELEDVLSEKEKALDGLQEHYEKNLSSVTGDLIINQLKKETQNENRPKVFKRANEIFNKITNGRYELSLDDKGEPNFRAYDTVLRLGQDLSELSTGTRVQLLLSVRLAYVETIESSIKLPLLADELLANSDDERAKAIIESLIEISKEGRQVFYFTAQADEVGKWITYLDEAKLDHKIFQLDTGSNEFHDYNDFRFDSDRFKVLKEVPLPNGKGHKEYGEIIQVKPFNLLLQNSSELPLWYLIENLDILYACLNMGVKTWGQLESYYKNDGKLQDLNEEIYNQLQNRIDLLNRYQELYRKGRSLPIDRDVLEASDAITPAFIDRVTDKLEEVNREPKQLLQTLNNGDISGFRKGKIDELEQYLLTEGYLDDQEILAPEAILVRMHAFISNTDMKIEEAVAFIERVLA